MVVHAGLQTGAAVLGEGVGGQGQDRRHVAPGADGAGGGGAVHAGHPHVHEDHVVARTFQRRDGFVAGGGRLDGAALAAQQGAGQKRADGIVLGQQDADACELNGGDAVVFDRGGAVGAGLVRRLGADGGQDALGQGRATQGLDQIAVEADGAITGDQIAFGRFQQDDPATARRQSRQRARRGVGVIDQDHRGRLRHDAARGLDLSASRRQDKRIDGAHSDRLAAQRLVARHRDGGEGGLEAEAGAPAGCGAVGPAFDLHRAVHGGGQFTHDGQT